MAQIPRRRRNNGRKHRPIMAIAAFAASTVLGAALAVLCFMSASDRLTTTSTHPHRSYFGGEASGRIAAVRLSEKQPAAAAEAAERFVRTDPVDPAAPSTLATVKLALNQPEQAYEAFRIAGGLGWRDIPTLLCWLIEARETGDVATAAQRTDALLRLSTDNPAAESTLVDFGDTPVGQAALVELLRKNPPWEGRFLTSTGRLTGSQLNARLAVLETAARSGAQFDCESVALAVKHLIHQKNYDRAKALWQITCSNRNGDLIFDGNFEAQASPSSSPFAWHLYSGGGLDVSIRGAPSPLKGQAAYADTNLTVRTPILSQTTVLSPGDYQVSWRTAVENGRPDSNLSVQILCNDTRTFLNLASLQSRIPPDNSVRMSFAVPSQGCPVQTLVVEIAAALPGLDEAGWIDDISLTRLSRANS